MVHALNMPAAFFEGLAGNGGDIDAVFAIQDEINQCALDMDDASQISEYYSHAHGKTIPGRRPSTAHLAPGTSGRPMHSFKGSPSDGSAISGPSRARRVSGRGGDAELPLPSTPAMGPSPLAQIYQTVVVVDDENAEEAQPSISLPRKRLSSTSRHRRSSTEPHIVRPIIGGPPADHMVLPVPPDTVQERADEDSPQAGASPGDLAEWTKRLTQIEQRQERIENLLISLAKGLKSEDTRGRQSTP